MTVSWPTSDVLNIGTFSITVTGAITRSDGSVYSDSSSFTLTVTSITCLTSTDTITITKGIDIAA